MMVVMMMMTMCGNDDDAQIAETWSSHEHSVLEKKVEVRNSLKVGLSVIPCFEEIN